MIKIDPIKTSLKDINSLYTVFQIGCLSEAGVQKGPQFSTNMPTSFI